DRRHPLALAMECGADQSGIHMPEATSQHVGLRASEQLLRVTVHECEAPFDIDRDETIRCGADGRDRRRGTPLEAAAEQLEVALHGRREVLDQREVVRSPVSRLQDRKSTRLNSSHVKISYAVFCLKKKK